MYKKFVPLLFFFTSLAQAPQFNWAKKTGDTTWTIDIVVDAMQNAYVAVFFDGTIDVDPGPGQHILSSVGGNFALCKLNAAGNFQWVCHIKNGDGANTADLALDATGNVYVAGTFSGTVDFDPGPGVFNLATTSSMCAYVMKLLPDGTFVWAKSLQGTGTTQSREIDTDINTADILITGNYDGVVDFDPGTGTYTMQSLISVRTAFVLKLDSTGNFVWAREFVSPVESMAENVTVDKLGNVFVSGHFSVSVDTDPGTSVQTLTANVLDAFIVKLNSGGNFVLSMQFRAHISNIVVDPQNNIVIGGIFDTCDFDPGVNTFTAVSSLNDYYILQLDQQGNFKWVTYSQTGQAGILDGIAGDKLGNIYAAGTFSGLLDLDGSANTFTISSNAQAAFITKLDIAGSFLWGGEMQPSGNIPECYPRCIATDPYGNIYTGGGMHGDAIDLDPTGTSYTVSANTPAYYTAYLNKLSSCILLDSASSITQICNSKVDTITIASQGNVSWFNTAVGGFTIGAGNTLVVGPLSAGTYTYYAQSSQCAGFFDRTPVLVQVHSNPAVQAQSSPSISCDNQSVKISLTGAQTYSVNGVATSASFAVSPSVTTIYTIQGRDGNGCEATTWLLQDVISCTDLAENEKDHRQIWPNPTQDLVFFSGFENHRVGLYNSAGLHLSSFEITSAVFELSVSQFASGVYVLKLMDSTGYVYHYKVVKTE